MNPDVLINTEAFRPKPKSKLPILWVSIVIILIIGLSLFILQISKQNISLLPKSQNQPQKVTTLISNSESLSEEKILQLIRQIFTAEKYKDIVTYINLAASEEDPEKSYDLYKKAFSLMSKAYTETKNIEFQYVMIDLKRYLATLPQYRQEEIVIPQ